MFQTFLPISYRPPALAGDFNRFEPFYKCPVCGVGKNRFKKNASTVKPARCPTPLSSGGAPAPRHSAVNPPPRAQGDYYAAMAAAKKASKAAASEKPAPGSARAARAALKAKAAEMGRDKDRESGRGGGGGGGGGGGLFGR